MMKQALWILASLAGIVYLAVMTWQGALPQQRQRVQFQARGVMTVTPDRVDRVELLREQRTVTLRRTPDGGWAREGGMPVSANLADRLALAIQYMQTSAPVREMSPDETREATPAQYGLDQPRIVVLLKSGPERVLSARFGGRNPEDMLQYMTLDGDPRTFLMSRFVGEEWSQLADALFRDP